MVRYRRNRVPGGTYFFTATLANRRARTLVDHIASLRDAFRAVRRRQQFLVDAIVVLPDHLHTIWTLPFGDDDYPGRWRAIKSRFVRALRSAGVSVVANDRGECRLWARRYWEHTIRDEQDMDRHLDYIHYNPVRHGLVQRVADWQFWSFHRYVRMGWLPGDWGGEPPVAEGHSYGE
jgi:putative transposase